MQSSVTHSRGLLFLIVAFSFSCGGDDSTSTGPCRSRIVANDLVITEIYGNSPGGDEGNEWFELYNASTKNLNLGGLSLVKTDGEGDSRREHVMREVLVEPGQYFVVGGILEEFRFDYIDYGYGPDLGTLGNSAGRLMLSCGDILIDRVNYVDLVEGKSAQLSGLVSPPNAEDNDDFENQFCTGNDNLFFGTELGTPQLANEICAPLTQNECVEDGALRSVNKPGPGDIEISEFLANPDSNQDTDPETGEIREGHDANGEWLELRVNAAIDLNGIQLGRAEADTGPGDVEQVIAAVECLPAAPGSYPVLVASTDGAINGGITSDLVLELSIRNTNDGLYVGVDDAVLSSFTYASTKAGVATQFDLEGDPCDATLAYGDGDLGTPGEANGECEPVIIIPDGQCFDTFLQDIRDIEPFDLGDLRISEWMPNPTLVNDADGEWFEVEILASGDLNGLQIGDAIAPFALDGTVSSDECLPFTAGQFAVIARGSGANGGLPAEAIEVSGFALNNTSADTIAIATNDTVIDSVSYASSSDGKATQIAGDDAECDATVLYNAQDYGTPGAINDATCGGGG